MSIFYSASYLLMGKYDRFTLTIEAMLMVFVAIGAYYLLSIMRWKWLVWIALVLAFRYTELWRGAQAILADATDHNAPYEHLAQAIASVQDHEAIVIASADAGVLPYYSGTKHFDLVGLNTSEVARAKTPQEVIALTATAKPDLVMIPILRRAGDSCSTVYREGHGLIGEHYMDLVQDTRFGSYRSIGGLDIGYYQMDLLVDTTSKYYASICSSAHALVTEPSRCYR
jgi:hypothetical protein